MINNTYDIGDVVKKGGKEQEIIRGQLADFVKENYKSVFLSIFFFIIFLLVWNYNSLFFARLATYVNVLPYYEFKDFFKIDFHLFVILKFVLWFICFVFFAKFSKFVMEKNVIVILLYFIILIYLIYILRLEFTSFCLSVMNFISDNHFNLSQLKSFNSVKPDYVFMFLDADNNITVLKWQYSNYFKDISDIIIRWVLFLVLGFFMSNQKIIFIDKRNIDIKIKDFKFIFLIPAIILVAFYTILELLGLNSGTYIFYNTFDWKYVTFIMPLIVYTEEIFYRNFLLRSLLNKAPFIVALFLSSLLFSMGHFLEKNLIFHLSIIILGTIIGYIWKKYGLKWAVIFHFIYNLLFQFIVFSA
ncbi:MAG: CPBP family intramembrane metalloprotease [Candidatus Muirbacterium halophilum]|nr:CPBP family intramembrane metalloprotease [Candidatus Muirbacterium halophilum]MCK9475232.1 CPBP family intramembrane metalloprotease [Candidatus Muirbacterium halophilum]